MKGGLLERFESYVVAGTNTYNGSACQQWTGGLSGGCGTFYDGERTVRAHRWAYEQAFGKIPNGLVVDHLCHNESDCPGGSGCEHRACVNLLHLEVVVFKTNVLRGKSVAVLNATKTHCDSGHEFTPENTYWREGERGCNTCKLLTRRAEWELERKNRIDLEQRPQDLITVTRTCAGNYSKKEHYACVQPSCECRCHNPEAALWPKSWKREVSPNPISAVATYTSDGSPTSVDGGEPS